MSDDEFIYTTEHVAPHPLWCPSCKQAAAERDEALRRAERLEEALRQANEKLADDEVAFERIARPAVIDAVSGFESRRRIARERLSALSQVPPAGEDEAGAVEDAT